MCKMNISLRCYWKFSLTPLAEEANCEIIPKTGWFIGFTATTHLLETHHLSAMCFMMTSALPSRSGPDDLIVRECPLCTQSLVLKSFWHPSCSGTLIHLDYHMFSSVLIYIPFFLSKYKDLYLSVYQSCARSLTSSFFFF